MIDEGYEDVYQLDGGIVKYLELYKDDGLWEGSLYVFDKRLKTNSSNSTKVIGQCSHCGESTADYINCANKACNELVLVCRDCTKGNKFSCSKCLVNT